MVARVRGGPGADGEDRAGGVCGRRGYCSVWPRRGGEAAVFSSGEKKALGGPVNWEKLVQVLNVLVVAD
jgi:hypothetical protein